MLYTVICVACFIMSEVAKRLLPFATPSLVQRIEQRIFQYNSILAVATGRSKLKGVRRKERKQQLKRRYEVVNGKLYHRHGDQLTMVFTQLEQVCTCTQMHVIYLLI